MTKVMEKKCRHCDKPITVRVADHRRGWGNYCSKSCKAKRQARHHDGRSPMRHKFCQTCGEPAVNGVYSPFGQDNGIEWQCEQHRDNTHPFDMG